MNAVEITISAQLNGAWREECIEKNKKARKPWCALLPDYDGDASCRHRLFH
ncbi:fibronectin type II domain-containing protein [Pectobacterium sp. 1950-15]|uniref:fibronectin type II domain-containing protein n=1 Tax=Pectobacterium sp. 1950-15 TaxID=3128982 RepID=UPI003FA748D6